MGRIGITYSDVARAADELQEKALYPTVAAVRSLLGTGSISTIVPHLKQWKSKQNNSISIGHGNNEYSFEYFQELSSAKLLLLLKELTSQIETGIKSFQICKMLEMEVQQLKNNKQLLIKEREEVKDRLETLLNELKV